MVKWSGAAEWGAEKSWQKYCSSQANEFDFRSFPNEHLIWYHHQKYHRHETNTNEGKRNRKHTRTPSSTKKMRVISYEKNRYFVCRWYGNSRTVHTWVNVSLCLFQFSFDVWIRFGIVCAGKYISVTHLIGWARCERMCAMRDKWKRTHAERWRESLTIHNAHTHTHSHGHILSLKSKSNQHH